MALSPNYEWAEPDNSSLVKNGAQDIRALGDAIDTSVWNVGFGQAGKNKIINGDFFWNQRNFTTTGGGFGFDRWSLATSGATATFTPQTFTLGTAPVTGYESKNFARITTTTGNDLCRLEQKIESVRTFAGQTATVSFWAKGTNPTTAGNLAITLQQFFGTGGSPSSSVNLTQQTFVLTANWIRYSFTFAVPSISGKTLGTNGDDSLSIWIGQGTSVSADAWTLDLWGVQVEYGSKATPFQTATGTLQGELAACMRYFQRFGGDNVYQVFGIGQATAAGQVYVNIPFLTQMRIVPTAAYSAGNTFAGVTANFGSRVVFTTVATDIATKSTATVNFSGASGLVAGNAAMVCGNNTTSATIDFSAEL